jgi:hypothetical protein
MMIWHGGRGVVHHTVALYRQQVRSTGCQRISASCVSLGSFRSSSVLSLVYGVSYLALQLTHEPAQSPGRADGAQAREVLSTTASALPHLFHLHI